ncbi:hypothetical protein QUB68_05025 [Microcoleus sp. A006_D1]|uniref:hypothetical protein n=1 Tax=Microcoleus sp. A006_D1 TaxID=3055267 RepID=UPI002FD6DAEF
MAHYIFRLLSICFAIAVITLFPGVASAGQIYIHNSAKGAITCDAAGDSRNTVKQNTQTIAIAQGGTFELNPQDFSTQTIDRLECAGYNVGNLKVRANSPDRYLSFIAQAQHSSVLLYLSKKNSYVPRNL